MRQLISFFYRGYVGEIQTQAAQADGLMDGRKDISQCMMQPLGVLEIEFFDVHAAWPEK